MDNNEDSESVNEDHPKASSICAIDKKSVHRICSGQVVLTLATAVKELLENSIDAGATIVEIKLREYGSELVEVSDNGMGVHPSNFEGLTLKHHTSKLRDFGDLINVDTFGFRGEALSSLCALCDMTVTTRHKEEAVGTRLEFDHNGRITKEEPQAKQIGTKVVLQNLFYTLPVRHKEFQRNLKKDFAKMVQVLNSYCIISTGVRITCTNITSKGSRSTVVSSQGNSLLQENISNVFGPKQCQNLLEFKQKVPGEDVCTEYGLKVDAPSLFQIEGFVSKCEHGQGRSSTDRQFLFINGRPFDSPKLTKVVNEVYHQYNRHQYPFVVLKIGVTKDGVDVNVTPDKRQVFMEGEKIMLATVKCSLVAMFNSTTSFLQMHQPALVTKLVKSQSEPEPVDHRSGFSHESQSNKFNTPVSSLSKLKRSFSSAFARSDSPFNKQQSASVSSPVSKQRRMDCFVRKSAPLDTNNGSSINHGHSIILHEDPNTPQTEDQTPLRSDVGGNIQTIEYPGGDVNGDQHDIVTIDESGDHQFTTVNNTVVGGEEVISSKHSHQFTTVNNTVVDGGDHQFTTENNTVVDSGEVINSKHSGDDQVVDLNPLLCKNTHSLDSSEKQCILQNVVGLESDNSRIGKTVRSDECVDDVHQGTDGTSIESQESSSLTGSDNSLSVDCYSHVDDTSATSLRLTHHRESEGDTNTGTIGPIPYGDSKDLLIDTTGSAVRLIQHEEIVEDENQQYHVDGAEDVEKTETQIAFSFEHFKQKWKNRCKDGTNTTFSRAFRAKINPADNQAAEQELQKEIKKESFSQMMVLGQFNKGFIITKLGNDLFIVDQHATDEKFNFETLQRETVIQSQKLIAPLNLELTASNETILVDNMDIFKKNGFEFLVDESGLPTQRVKLTSTPVSKNWNFGKEDIEEMLFMLSDSPGVMCRPSRVRAMFASRACRKSIMIGTVLNNAQMKKLLCHMGEIEQPWNCPHGRPTMRHLINLDMIPK